MSSTGTIISTANQTNYFYLMADLAHKSDTPDFLPKMTTKYAIPLWTAGVSYSETLFC